MCNDVKRKKNQRRIQEFLLGGRGGGVGPNFGSERTVELFLWQITSHRDDHVILNL